MKIFINHSFKDAEIARLLSVFLERLDVNVDIFCSSIDGTIYAGQNFINVIDNALDNCDIFIALLSSNYQNSKYSFVELGYAYSRMIHEKKEWIVPLALPGGESVLENTPLSNIEIFKLNNINHITNLIDYWGLTRNLRNNEIRNFIDSINSEFVKSSDIFCSSNIIGCCSDQTLPDAIRCYKNSDEVFINFSFENKSKNDYPDFISTVFNFYNELDLLQYYRANNNLKLHFIVENYTNSINKIQIELQTETNRLIGKPQVFNIGKGLTPIDVSISDYSQYTRDLSRLYNLCFVMKKEYFNEEEGTVIIRDLSIR